MKQWYFCTMGNRRQNPGGSLVVAKARGGDASARQKERGRRTPAFPFLLPLISYHCFSLAELSHPAQKPWKLSLQVSAPLIPRVGMGKSWKWMWGQKCRDGTISENIANGELWLGKKVGPRTRLIPSTEPGIRSRAVSITGCVHSRCELSRLLSRPHSGCLSLAPLHTMPARCDVGHS